MDNRKEIYCEDPFTKMCNLYLCYQNEGIVKKRLYHAYLTIKEEKEANSLAYQNTLKFIHFIKQGVAYFQAAKQNDVMVQPLLLYYGITTFLKAIILMHDPYYPSTTTILQHGLTTRKKKKNNYVFLQDDIKVQKEGLLPHFYEKVFQQFAITHKKYKVLDLYSTIPELQHALMFMHKSKTMIPVQIEKMDALSWKYSFDQNNLISNDLHFSAIYDLFRQGVTANTEAVSILDHEYSIVVTTKIENDVFQHDHAQIVEDYRGNYYFFFRYRLALNKEIIIFYMLMYVLSMLCRYDAELWGEILYSLDSHDLFLINELLQLTLRKFPNLILNYLAQQKYIFLS